MVAARAHMRLWQKYDWPAEAGIKADLVGIHRFDGKEVPEWLVDTRKWEVPLCKTRVALCYYLLEDILNARSYAREVVEDVLEFLYGDWRKTAKTDLKIADPGWWQKHSSWMMPFQVGILWASALGDWKSLRRMAEFPQLDVDVSPGYTKADRDYYLAIACYLRDGENAEIAPLAARIQGETKLKPQLLLRVLQGIRRQKESAFNEALSAYLRYFRKSEFRKRMLTSLFAIDGTFLINLARYKGLRVAYPLEYEDYVINLTR